MSILIVRGPHGSGHSLSADFLYNLQQQALDAGRILELRACGALRDFIGLVSAAKSEAIIDAQLQMYPAEQSAVDYDLGRKVALVNLYRALGGGWSLNDSQWISTSGASGPAKPPAP